MSGPAQPGWQRAGLAGAPDALGALVSPPADSGAPGGEQAGPLSDDTTVLAESLRQPERFGRIYDLHFPGIYGYIASRLGPDDADDLTNLDLEAQVFDGRVAGVTFGQVLNFNHLRTFFQTI